MSDCAMELEVSSGQTAESPGSSLSTIRCGSFRNHV